MHTSAVVRSAERLVVAATMGPAGHHVHAWRLTVVPGLIEVRADADRFPATGDPTGRRLHLSCGAALVNLRLAAAQVGYEAVVRPLPDAGRPSLLAAVRLAGRRRITRAERLMYAATLRPFAPRRGGHQVLPFAELAEAARLEGAALRRCAGTAVLTTCGDSPADWLRAGQALQRVLLGSAASFRYGAGAEELREAGRVIEPGEVPQVFLDGLPGTAVGGQHERQGHRERVR
ncbi:hypothetical protein [Spirillospora sp. NPDC029432]|uniref:hypothetical protein n=1 Tax=Spirillospora sp. NPDC029432 TaxID=3154599 RepID=UPI0034513CB6